jgi:hypothetical protein
MVFGRVVNRQVQMEQLVRACLRARVAKNRTKISIGGNTCHKRKISSCRTRWPFSSKSSQDACSIRKVPALQNVNGAQLGNK